MIEKFNDLNIEYYLEFDLTNYNTMKLISKCYMLVKPKNIDELKFVLSVIKDNNKKYFVIGNGSNIILPVYYDGVVIKLNYFNKLQFDDGKITVDCGYMLNKLALDVSNKGYTNLEWACHIPGTIGGAIYSNAGAYDKSISDLISTITILENNEIKTISNSEAKFEYRTSIFRNNNLIILSCTMNIKKGNIDEIKMIIKDRFNKRVLSQPLNYPSCGSVFRNPLLAPAGKLIDDANLKGTQVGDLKISEKHANFIININKGTKDDYEILVKKIKDTIKEKYNVDLILEQEVIE